MPLAAARLGRRVPTKLREPGDLPAEERQYPGGVSWWEWTDAARQSGAAIVENEPCLSGRCPAPPPSQGRVVMGNDYGLTLSICLRCRDGREERDTDLDQRGGRRLASAVQSVFAESTAAGRSVALRGVNCMSQCKRPCTIALSGPGRFTYLFGDLDPQFHTDDVLAVAAAYADAVDGFLPRPARPEVLRAGILGRIPPIGSAGDLVEPLQTLPSQSNPETETL